MTKIAIIGTNGIPSKYGGFETLVEYLVVYLAGRYEVTVYCAAPNHHTKLTEYKGARLEYINLSANGWQSIFFDIISYYKTYRKYDKIIILGSSGCIALPLFARYRNKFIFNFGGLDWDRSKWSFFTRKFLKLTESLGIRFSEHLVSDNIGIKEYIKKQYGRDSTLVTYGGDQAVKTIPSDADFVNYPFLKDDYAFSVARIQPDNNIEMLLQTFNQDSVYPFVLVGNWNKSAYGVKIKQQYAGKPNLILLEAIYDQRELNALRSSCKVYLHGHSAGGTNPALVEAMNLGLPIFAYNNVFNRYTTNFEAGYFLSSEELAAKLSAISNSELKQIGQKMYNIAKSEYQWKVIADKYANIIDK